MRLKTSRIRALADVGVQLDEGQTLDPDLNYGMDTSQIPPCAQRGEEFDLADVSAP